MRNLSPIERNRIDLDQFLGCDSQVTALVWDVKNDALIFTSMNLNQPSSSQLNRLQSNGDVSVVTSWEENAGHEVRSLHYFADIFSACIVFDNGNIVHVQEKPILVTQIVGNVESGVRAAAWSPDEEVVGLITGNDSLVLMSRDFDLIMEVAFSVHDVKTSNCVSVGWGKAETQFKGKNANVMKDPTISEHTDVGNISNNDDMSVRISWRGDGEYLAVSSVDSNRRFIRVFNRQGVLDSVSEPVDSLEPPLSWKPAGNVIAGVQSLKHQLDIVLFERNGLRHGGFTADSFPDSCIEPDVIWGVFWNCDSSVLAICFRKKIQLWCMGNYHWYLKQVLSVPNSMNHWNDFQWHPEIPLKFCLRSEDFLTMHAFVSTINSGSSSCPNDFGVVGVVDGFRLNLTPFRYATVPPPMSFRTVSLKYVPIDICFGSNSKRVVILHRHGIDQIDWSFDKKTSLRYPQLMETVFEPDESVTFRQICFASEAALYALGEDFCNKSVLYRLEIKENHIIESRKLNIETSGTITGLRYSDQAGTFIYQYSSGDVYKYNEKQQNSTFICSFSVICPIMDSIVVDGKLLVVGLSQSGQLFICDRQISDSCSSFVVSGRLLIFITIQHFIKIVYVEGDIEEIDIPVDNAISDERCRSVERGARIVCAIPSNFSVILQMPRGNLETIYPRALVLGGVRESINARNYRAAYLTCRDHRVDLNILHDYSSNQFFECIGDFIRQISTVDFIDAFLSHIREDDVTQTKYPEPRRRTATSFQSQLILSGSPNKVNRICDAITEFLHRNLLESHFQNIITAYVCKLPPDNESALRLISTRRALRDYENSIEHICFLSDIEKLYETALGIYDLELALKIAQQAQKDPREYLPFLQALQDMQENRRRYTIDNYLGRFSSALRNLCLMGDKYFPEALRFVIDKSLYIDALKLYQETPEKLKEITRAYAHYLDENSMFREAGLAFEQLDMVDAAMNSYKKAGLWQQCLSLKASSRRPDLGELSLYFARNLVEAKDYDSAAKIYLDYQKDEEQAARLFCLGNNYIEAMRLAMMSRQEDLILEKVIDPLLVEKFGQTTEMLADYKSQFILQARRVSELQLKKNEDPVTFFDGQTEANAPDDISIAPTHVSTSMSIFTRYTAIRTEVTGVSRRSSKNRRKEERKRARGKKGSIYEEEYLLNSIRRLIERINQTMPDTERLVECMYRRKMCQNAQVIQQQAAEVISIIGVGLSDVFKSHSAIPSAIGVVDNHIELSTLPTLNTFRRISLLQ